MLETYDGQESFEDSMTVCFDGEEYGYNFRLKKNSDGELESYLFVLAHQELVDKLDADLIEKEHRSKGLPYESLNSLSHQINKICKLIPSCKEINVAFCNTHFPSDEYLSRLLGKLENKVLEILSFYSTKINKDAVHEFAR